ncbi:MAG: putative proteasome accessory factor [Actinomycetota bacterium]
MKRSSARPVNVRLRRLLVMLPWLRERGTVSTHEMAAHFGVTVEELVADLTLASMCGVSQDPRDLIDLFVDGDEVHFGLPKYFDRPLRLTVPEAFSLVVSAKAARSLPGGDENEALVTAIDKIARTIGAEHLSGVDIEMDVPSTVDELRAAAERGAVVSLEYWSPATGSTTSRTVVVFEVFAEGSHWYVRGFDTDRDAERTFRLDRIESWADTGRVDPRPPSPRRPWFVGSDDVREVTLVIDAGWLWVLEQYPLLESTSIDGARVRVRLLVTSDRWLERLVLRLGSHGEVETPVEMQPPGPEAARRVLARYRRT